MFVITVVVVVTAYACKIKEIEKNLTGSLIRQKTPLRVLGRRKNYTREKYIYETKTKKVADNAIEIRITCEGGLYIKELITGNEGRTEPNVASIIDANVLSIKLDVIDILINWKLI